MMDRNKIEEIANHYGLENQSRQLIEEMAELTVALNKYHRVFSKEYRTIKDCAKLETLTMNIAEEMTDVQIMLEQIKFLLGVTVGDIEYIAEKKLKRQIKRMDKE